MLTRPTGQRPPMLEEIPSGEAFPDQPTEFFHGLQDDDRLSLPSIAALADRLPQSVIYDTAAQPLLVPEGGPPRAPSSDPVT